MRKFSRRIAFVLIFVAAVIGPGHGESQAITYTYAGTCTMFCDPPNLTVSGSISFLDSALVSGSPYPAPTSFALHFGTVDITDATVDSFGLFASPTPPFPALPVPAIVPTDLTSFVADLHAGEDPVPPATGADAIIITASGPWISSPGGNCIGADCHSAPHHRPHVLPPADDLRARVDNVGEHHGRAAKHVVFHLDSLVEGNVVLYFDVVANDDSSADKTVLPEGAASADAAAAHDMAKVPDLGALPNDAGLVDDAGGMDIVIMSGRRHRWSPVGVRSYRSIR